jgi:uncharacterized RDD family membrane protein YckC
MLDRDQIETPENVLLARPLAGVGSRGIAVLIDSLLLAGLFVLIYVVLWIGGLVGLSRFEAAETAGIVLAIIGTFLVFWFYFVFFEIRLNGQTPGKRAVGIRVTTDHGAPAGFTEVVIRNLLRPVDAIAFYGLGIVVMFISSRQQRLGDLAAGTVVVSEQRREYSARSDRRKDRRSWDMATTAEALQATGLKPEEYAALNQYWKRRREFSTAARRRVLPKLLGPVLERRTDAPADRSLQSLELYLRDLMAKARQAEQDASAGDEGGRP